MKNILYLMSLIISIIAILTSTILFIIELFNPLFTDALIADIIVFLMGVTNILIYISKKNKNVFQPSNKPHKPLFIGRSYGYSPKNYEEFKKSEKRNFDTIKDDDIYQGWICSKSGENNQTEFITIEQYNNLPIEERNKIFQENKND